jgi:hypothetical protein
MTISLLRFPMFAFFGLGFLLFCAIIAVAVFLAVKSGREGSTKLGGFAGCAIALALLVTAGIGAIGCTAIAIVNAPNEFVQRGPVKRLELHLDDDGAPARAGGTPGEDEPEDESAPLDEKHAVSLRFDIAGIDSARSRAGSATTRTATSPYTISTEVGEGGEVLHLDVSLPISRRELRRFRANFHRDFPDVRLPRRVEIELRHEDDSGDD